MLLQKSSLMVFCFEKILQQWQLGNGTENTMNGEKKINNKKHACLCTFMLGFYMMERNLIIINSFRAISDKKHIHLQTYKYTFTP